MKFQTAQWVRVLLGLLFVGTLYAQTEALSLTEDEKIWLRGVNRPLIVGVCEIPNQVLIQNGEYRGFAIDLYEKIARLTGLKFRYRRYDSWQTLMEGIKRGEADILFLAQKTPSRLGYLDFTDTVLTLHNKVIVRTDQKGRFRLDRAKGARVAVTRGSAIEEYLKERFKAIKIVPTPSLVEALKLLSASKVDAVVAEPVRAGYYMERYDIDNLRIDGDLRYVYYLSVASRNDLPMLNVVLSKAVNAIDPKELAALNLKWGYVKDKEVVYDRRVFAYLGIAIAAIIPFAFFLYGANKRLKREIVAKHRAMEKLTELLKEREHMEEILRRQIQKELERNRRQELFLLQRDRMAQMGELLSMIAHQWRQPLNNLSLVCQTLFLKIRKQEALSRHTQTLENEARQQIALMSRTIDDFMDFYKLDEKKRIFDLAATVEKSIKMVEPAFEKLGIRITRRLEGEWPVEGIPNALAQVVLNILNNAKEAVAERRENGGWIDVELQKEGRKVYLRIEDNGGGIEDAVMERIFDPYFSTKERNGTGLGLYMAKKIIEEQLGGLIWAENGKEGAIFVIELSLADER